MARPLYVEGTRPVEIMLDEGPALAITRQGEATRLVPLHLLSHIVARGDDIQWSQAALTACAEQGIPIFLSDEEHHLTATLRAARDTPVEDWHRFMRLIEDPDGIDYYKQFIQAKARQSQRDVSERWRRQPEIHLPGYHRAARIVRSAIRADLEAQLHQRGFRRRLALLRQAGIDLPQDFAGILEPLVHWVLNETWKRAVLEQAAPTTPEPWTRRMLLHAYERKADFVRDSIRALIVSFLYWLAEADTQYLFTGER